ncbi:hypothetical protein ON010_g7849 [Phytophthora cinnamomi]|nr:hypothetical protein ON010_g7849 [Phytophthora cinnamomi]
MVIYFRTEPRPKSNTTSKKQILKHPAIEAKSCRALLDLVHQSLLGDVRLHVGEGRQGDVVQGLLGEEGLVTRDQHVREREQAGQRFVADDGARAVRVEVLALALEHVEADRADLAALEAVHQSLGVDQAAAARVDDHDAVLHLGDALGVDRVLGRREQRAVQRDDVGAGPHLVQRHVLHAVAQGLGILHHIVAQHLGAEAGGDASEERANLARAHDADGLAVHVKAQQARQAEVLLARAVVRAVDLAVQRRHAGDGHAQLLGHLEVDHVEAGAAQEHGLGAAGGQHAQSGLVGHVVDEDADALAALSQLRGVRVQARGEELELVGGGDALLLGDALHRLDVVAVRREEGDLHGGDSYRMGHNKNILTFGPYWVQGDAADGRSLVRRATPSGTRLLARRSTGMLCMLKRGPPSLVDTKRRNLKKRSNQDEQADTKAK